MELIQTPVNYKPDSPISTPYLQARAEWDDRLGALSASAANWRYAFFAVTLLAFGLLVGNAVQLNSQKTIPMVIAVNQDSGEAAVLGRAIAKPYQPGEPEVRFFLLQYLKFVRAVPADPVVIKANWLAAYKFLRAEAAQQLNQMTAEDESNPLKKIGLQTVTVQPISFLYVEGSKSYQVRWKETIFSDRGEALDTYNMTGLFTLEYQQPTSEEVLLVNPLGIYIKSFQWNRELTGETR